VERKRVAVLISGRGSNLAALMAAAAAPKFPAEIVLVVSDRLDAAGLSIAARGGIPTAVVERQDFADRASFEADLDKALRSAGSELVCLAGFMRLLSADFVETWRDRLLNIHPSLLPAFPGLDTHARALATGVKIHGATVHFVRAETDRGPIIAQAAVPVLSDDTPEALAARVLAAEHRLYPLALRLVAGGAARVVGERVLIAHQYAPEATLFSPPLAGRG
jgi:phosphoribosylglycinamide formyltransferase-1